MSIPPIRPNDNSGKCNLPSGVQEKPDEPYPEARVTSADEPRQRSAKVEHKSTAGAPVSTITAIALVAKYRRRTLDVCVTTRTNRGSMA